MRRHRYRRPAPGLALKAGGRRLLYELRRASQADPAGPASAATTSNTAAQDESALGRAPCNTQRLYTRLRCDPTFFLTDGLAAAAIEPAAEAAAEAGADMTAS